ncbi:uncharacterized protein BKA55DRAFT_743972 [Fusarium redolens]|uniref:Uncharacterized protein n=1 Tax=Fusarium redolens TaxID=48865 RepID=A0A9P9JQ35_FUSRE|nr:uncharacterized protein BKA55DRAFT_743972 [Fusarium redolens]KAH7220511.1 hypothetical protein BKA55DRAFT_743972 [Fusarium redolens]
MKISEVLDILSSRDSLDAHDFGKPLEKDDDGLLSYHPERLPSAKAVELFTERSSSGGLPVNLLNIGCLKENAIPVCFSNDKDYGLMRTRTDNGKSEKQEWRDLDDCLTFQLLASKGAAHLQHVDRHGVYTTALTEQGKKLWLAWPGLSLEELESRHVPDGGVAILIDEGDMLIQP